MKLILLALCLLLAGCRADDSSTPANANRSPNSSVDTSMPIGDAEERVAVAARLRRSLREQNVAANVVVNGTKLTVSYNSASIEDAPDAFLKQQGEAGMARIANAGFETLIISAQDSSGQTRTKEIPVAQYRTK